ncbi:hypothetical protein ACTXT7_005881 [Hymenolepis weldensis]
MCNPLTQSEDYFEYVITFLPSLIYVDGKSKESTKNKITEICKKIYSIGIESKETREREVKEFECFICELNKCIKSKSTQSTEQYMSVKNENLSMPTNDDGEIADEHDGLNLVRQSLKQLFHELMKFEVEIGDQLADNMDEFERALSTILDNFLQALEEEMALCREVANEYNEQFSNHCFHLLEKVSLDNIGVEITPQLKKIFENKDTLTEALADCQAERINSIDAKMDSIRDQSQTWFKNIIEGFRKTQITDRRNNRVFEIHKFIEDQRKELDLSIETTS